MWTFDQALQALHLSGINVQPWHREMLLGMRASDGLIAQSAVSLFLRITA